MKTKSKLGVINKDKKLFIVIDTLIKVLLIILVVILKNKLLYTEKYSEAVIYNIICLGTIGLISSSLYFFERRLQKKALRHFSCIISTVLLLVSIVYLGFGIRAFIYNNSLELLNMSDNYSLGEAKSFKRQIDNIFEEQVSVSTKRDISIRNFYEDEDSYLLYIDDINGEYTLKFYVDVVDSKIRNIYYVMDEVKFYLYEEYKKTDWFEYYYAMDIVRNVLGEDTLRDDLNDAIMDEVNKQLGDPLSIMLSYDDLNYDMDNKNFFVECYVDIMDGLGGIDSKKGIIEFSSIGDEKIGVLDSGYYGDYSFNYVKWNVKIID